ncbi:MAG: AmmeMemoRadiSam system radical SAM enzyme [Phycisphaerae bacterium]|nr:AmmeMemoRadiSam system radical SAM enzyme [Phycisphaerae bacterium]MCZ2399644.1 AmmeMemoRadiSam system radical SAM enzyme [Phycisphaerae bacterium]NUQ48680.1 AmmeMemoRadiSam system radical SAM enzyme [Phycisphaerae bacterium]
MSTQAVPLRTLLADNTAPAADELIRHEPGGVVRCLACGHRCKVLPGRNGVCQVRFNRDGELRVPFGYVAGLAVDPIEKKPFYHAYPGSRALSFGMLGCDYHCGYCQNWVTSQSLRDDSALAQPQFVDAERIVRLAIEHECRVVTSTYNEPLITSEWAIEIFRLARRAGLVCSYVSNGNGTPQVLEYIRPYVDLYKVDLKAFRDKTYRDLGGVLQNTLDTIRRLRQMDFWVEIVTLLVPGLNDTDSEIRELAEFVAGVSPDIPWHVTAFHPDYKMSDTDGTPVDTLLRAAQIGRESGLRFVYPGNCHGLVGDAENTRCPTCGELLVERRGFSVREVRIVGGACPACRTVVPGVWGV